MNLAAQSSTVEGLVNGPRPRVAAGGDGAFVRVPGFVHHAFSQWEGGRHCFRRMICKALDEFLTSDQSPDEGDRAEDRAQRSLRVWLRQEVQEMLRRGALKASLCFARGAIHAGPR